MCHVLLSDAVTSQHALLTRASTMSSPSHSDASKHIVGAYVVLVCLSLIQRGIDCPTWLQVTALDTSQNFMAVGSVAFVWA